MINGIVNNLYILFLSIVAFIIIKVIIRKISSEISWQWENSWLGKSELLNKTIEIAIVYTILASLVTLQQIYSFIYLGKEENNGGIIIGILTLYGIFYTFIQFAIGYASQNEKDKHWGKSKAKAILIDNTEYRLFLSKTFKVLLVFCSIYPFLKNEAVFTVILSFISSIVKVEKNFLMSLWSVGIFCIYILYVLLFVKSLVLMRKFFDIQEHADYQSIRKIEYETIKSYQELFLSFYNKKEQYYRERNYFLEVLMDDLSAVKNEEKRVMLKKIFEKCLDKYKFQQCLQMDKIKQGRKISEKIIEKYRDKSQYLADHFKEFFLYLDTSKIEFDFEELLSFYEIHDTVLYNQVYVVSSGKYEKIIDETISIYEQDKFSWEYDKNTLFFHIPDLIWNRVNTYEKLKKLNHSILDRQSSKVLLKKYYEKLNKAEYTNGEKRLLDEYNIYLHRVIDKCREFQDDFNNDKELYLFASWSYDQGERKIHPIIQEQIFNYIKDLEYSESNKEYFEVLIRKIDYKYVLAIIFYIMLYTGSDSYSKWKNDVTFLRKINDSFFYYNKINSEENINFVSSIIERSNIGHKILRKLVTWIMNNVEKNLTTNLIHECNSLDYVSYAKFLKFKYIFHTSGYFIPDLSKVDIIRLKKEGLGDWRVAFLREILKTPSLLKEDFFSMHQLRFSEQILNSCLHNYINEIEDFRLFYIDIYFSINEEQFIKMTEEFSFIRKSILDYLILKLDDELYEYLLLNNQITSILITNLRNHLYGSNNSIRSYVDDLVRSANECSSDILSVVKKKRIIIKLQKLLYDDFNRLVIE